MKRLSGACALEYGHVGCGLRCVGRDSVLSCDLYYLCFWLSNSMDCLDVHNNCINLFT